MSDGEVRPFLEKHIKNYFKFLLTYHQNAFYYIIWSDSNVTVLDFIITKYETLTNPFHCIIILI